MGSWGRGSSPSHPDGGNTGYEPRQLRQAWVDPDTSLGKYWVNVGVGVPPTECRRSLWSLGQGSGQE